MSKCLMYHAESSNLTSQELATTVGTIAAAMMAEEILEKYMIVINEDVSRRSMY